MSHPKMLLALSCLMAASACAVPETATRNLAFSATEPVETAVLRPAPQISIDEIAVYIAPGVAKGTWAVLHEATAEAARAFAGERSVILDVELVRQRRNTLEVSWMLRDRRTGLPLSAPQSIATPYAPDAGQDHAKARLATWLVDAIHQQGDPATSRYGLGTL